MIRKNRGCIAETKACLFRHGDKGFDILLNDGEVADPNRSPDAVRYGHRHERGDAFPGRETPRAIIRARRLFESRKEM